LNNKEIPRKSYGGNSQQTRSIKIKLVFKNKKKNYLYQEDLTLSYLNLTKNDLATWLRKSTKK